jgi:hypothetical protein
MATSNSEEPLVNTLSLSDQKIAMFANVNSRSLSLASISSEGSTESHAVEQEDIIALTQDVRSFKDVLSRLRKVYQSEADTIETIRVTSHERLSDVLKILRHILEKYPAIQSHDLVSAAGALIGTVKALNKPRENEIDDIHMQDPKEFYEALDGLALAFSSRVSEYLMGDLDSNVSVSSASSKTKSYENLLHSHDPDSGVLNTQQTEEDIMNSDEIDARLLLIDRGVDHALERAKIWGKYAKDVLNYVEKRTAMQMDLSKNLTKLVQSSRPQLQEEIFLPFQSIYCLALDQDLEMCALMQASCGLLQGCKFLEPLHSRRVEHERTRKQLKDVWHRELKKMQDEVTSLKKAKNSYIQRHQEWERCRDATRIAEQGAELGATADNKLDKRKKLEEEAASKAIEAEAHYRNCVDEANSRHRNLLNVKGSVLQQVRELLMQADQTMKAVTVSYFQQQHSLTASSPVQFQTLCESSRLYEPGSQYMKFVKRLSDPEMESLLNPFSFEQYTEGQDNVLYLDKQRKSSASLDINDEGTVAGVGFKSRMAWSPNVGAVEPSDTESIESRESAKSRDTSPFHSPTVEPKTFQNYPAHEDHEDIEAAGGAHPKRHIMSRAANSHDFKKLNKPSRCRECDSFVYFNGYECAKCGLSAHKKCLETIHLMCGQKRLPRKMTTFGVALGDHLLQVGAEIPPLVCRCVHEIDQRGINIKGLYRVSGVKSKVEKLCQAFENGAELVDLSDVHPNVISNVVKLYMRQLPEPLCTFRLYSDFIREGRRCPALEPGQSKPGDWEKMETDAAENLRRLCLQLPKYHLKTLGFLCHHLHRISLQSETNNMPASNLAIVFGPTLLRTSESPATLSSVVDTKEQVRVVELMAKYALDVFGPEANLIPREYEHRPVKHKHKREQSPRLDELIEEHRAGSFTDEENDNEPIPFFLLPDDSQKVKKSPLLTRPGSPPHIQLVSLKNFSGLENVRAGQISGQDSVDSTPHRLRHQPTPSLDKPQDKDGEKQNISILEENKVKIQVPGLPVGKG